MTEESTGGDTAGEERSLNERIRNAKSELEHMIDLNPQIMLLLDRAGVVVRANRALLELLGPPDFRGILGRRIGEIFPADAVDLFDSLLTDESGYASHDAAVVLPGRGLCDFRFTVVGRGRETDLCAVIVEDLTAEKEQAQQTEMRHKQEAAQQLMGALMHHVNQPLTVIMVRAKLMHLAIEQGDMRPDELKKSLEDIMDFTMQVSDILARMERPREYVTQPYLDGVEIMDIDRSAGSEEPPEDLP